MKKKLFLLLSAVVLTSSIAAEDFTKYVNPFIGTATVGHIYPAATLPFAMVQLGPDNILPNTNEWALASGYNNKYNIITGFSHTHLSGTGASDMCDISFMPVIGDVPFVQKANNSYASKYSHSSEEASPGYYKVMLDDYGIKVELTSTLRTGFHLYTYPASAKAGIMIDMEHGNADNVKESFLRIVDDQTIEGMRRSTGFVDDHCYYFYARFSKPFTKITSFKDGKTDDASMHEEVNGISTKMLLQFATTEGEQIMVKVGLSTTSCEGAKNNLDTEVSDWDFKAVRQKATDVWNSLLGRMEITAPTNDMKISAYTSLYHTLLMPNLVTDVDGKYMGWDQKLHKSDNGDMYTNFSLWDTYRALHPFFELLYPEKNSHFIKSLLEKYKQTGLLATNEYGLCETWCMIGNHAVNPIVDAFLKGDKTFDAELAYEAVKTSMTKDHVKSSWSVYNKYGYFPYDSGSTDQQRIESVSRTMEACYDDYCVGMMAKSLGKKTDADFFFKRASNYKHLFDPHYGLVRGKNIAGKWNEPFNPYSLAGADDKHAYRNDYTEGNAWQWTWHVQHDPNGLIGLFPSKKAFVQKLDTLFFVDQSKLKGLDKVPDVSGLIGCYAHGNEPSHHVAYLYNYAGRIDKTAEIVRMVFDRFYLNRPDGLCGNDDCGQMSAWYLFSGMGFYPVNPISGEYVFGAPQFSTVTLHLPNGKTFSIKTDNLSAENKYISRAILNGKNIPLTVLKYKDIMKGGQLEYRMTDKANNKK